MKSIIIPSFKLPVFESSGIHCSSYFQLLCDSVCEKIIFPQNTGHVRKGLTDPTLQSCLCQYVKDLSGMRILKGKKAKTLSILLFLTVSPDSGE